MAAHALFTIFVLLAAGPVTATMTPPPPKTRAEPVAETVHGAKIVDPYRWLEDGDAAAVKTWTEAQNAYTRTVLGPVRGRDAIEKRLWELHEIGSMGPPVPRGRGKQRRYFYTRRDGRQNQPVLYVRASVEGEDRALVDVNALAAGGTVALDWWFPTDDARFVAYGISRDGSEESELHIKEVATGRELGDSIARTRHASLAWRPDATGFYYTRYPRPGDVPKGDENYFRHVYFHKLGADPATDVKIYGEGRDKTDWASVLLSPNGRWLGVEVAQGWAKSEIYLIDTSKKGPPKPVVVVEGRPALYNMIDVLDDRMYVLTNEEAPRYRLFAVDPRSPERKRWREVIPQGEDTLESVSVVGGKLVARYLKDASSRVRVFSTTGKLERELPLPALGTVSAFGGEPKGKELFFNFTSYLMPTIIFRQDLGAPKAAPTVWRKIEAPLDAGAFEVRQERFPSKDGTSIPLFLVHKKGLNRDGRNPTLLYGYGGFNISLTPAFAARVAPFLERGGVFAEVNLRGGAEYGEAWHQAGMLDKKQNVFDDFVAAAEFLIREKITSPDRLAISGRSNGGLLTSAALTQRPDLFRAVISGVPLTDMVRYHKFRIARLWIPEYGDPEKAAEFKWLYAYSPYHKVADRTPYPSVFIFTAESDTRVDPMHARKMTARLQAATSSGRPVLLRLESQAGHGQGKPLAKVIDQYTDELAFLLRELGMEAPR